MKSKTKKLVALSLTATLCSALAFVATLTSPKEVSASTTTTFKMADGAGIRYTAEAGKKEGLRFIVLADETTKNAIVNSGTIGFVATAAQNFTGIESDYKTEMADFAHEFPVTESDFYQNAEEYGDLYCANVVINMGTNDTVENFTERTYSAVAYYSTGTDTYAYTENRQERSIQEVASKLYMQGDADWAKVSQTYTAIGTDTTPFLVENGENGEENSYQNLVVKAKEENSTVQNYKFEMTENVIAETTVEDVVVNANEYTVTSPEGLIWDNTNACENFVWMSGDNGDTTGFEVSYDANAKFNGTGNGAVKMTVDLTGVSEGKNSNISFSFASRFSKDYYKELYEAGYTHITVRYMIPSYGGVQMPASVLNEMGVVCDVKEASVTHIYEDGTSGAWYQWFENGAPHMDKWLELSSPINAGFDGLTSFDLFKLNVPTAGKKLTIYVDNIYMTKSAGDVATEEKDAGTVVDLTTDCGFAFDGAYNAIESYTKDGEAVSATDNKITLEEGFYEFTFRADNRFGIAKKIYDASAVIEEKQVLWNIANDTTLSNISTSVLYVNDGSGVYEGQTATITYRSDLGCAQVVHSTDYSYSDLIIKPAQSKAYYEKLKSLGYKYVTIPFNFYGGEFKMAAGGSEGGEMTHRNNIYVGNTGLVTVVKNQDGSLTETDFAGAGPWTTNATSFTVSYSIDLFINSYDANGTKILRMMTMYGAGAGVFGNYDFSEIQFTKDGQMMS